MEAMTEARTAFNLKVLRRHDPSIVQLVETASFVVLYNYHGGEWTKTGVEGPMFLFRRKATPYNGFFIMNRNGVENFSADVTADDDLEITPEFIIYRPETMGDNEVYGIWVFEASQRQTVGEALLNLQKMLDPPKEDPLPLNPQKDTKVDKQPSQAKQQQQPTPQHQTNGKQNSKSKKSAKQAAQAQQPAAVTATGSANPVDTQEQNPASSGQINLDDLFGSPPAAVPQEKASSSSSSSAPSAENEAASAAAGGNSVNLLDSLFSKAAIAPSGPPAQAPTSNGNVDARQGQLEPQASQHEPSVPLQSQSQSHSQNLLALLGGKPEPQPASPASPPASSSHSQNLLALLGVSSSSSSSSPSPASPSVSVHTSSQPDPPSQMQPNTSLPTQTPPPRTMSSTSLPAPTLPRSNAQSEAAPTTAKEQGTADLVLNTTQHRIGTADNGDPLSKREFVTSLLSLIHTDPDFVTELYGAYLQRVS